MKKGLSAVLAFAITFFGISVTYAGVIGDPTPQLQQAVDNYVQAYGVEEGMSAVTLSVSAPGINPITVASGCKEKAYPDLNPPVPCTPVSTSDLYQIGSNTKVFMAVILLQLEAEHVQNFNINDKVSQYLTLPAQWQNEGGNDVTVKQMLNMTGGIPAYDDNQQFVVDLTHNLNRQFTQADLINYAGQLPMMFTPGTKWYYSNTSYILAGMLIEKLTGHSVKYEIQQRIFNRYGLNTMYYEPHAYPGNLYGQMVHGYMEEEELADYIPMGTDMTAYNLSWASSAGAIVSTTSDVLKWVQALYTSPALLAPQQRQELESLVSTATGQPIVKPTPSDPSAYGLGIFSLLVSGQVVYSYEGGTMAYREIYVYFPEENIVITAGLNSESDIDHALQLVSTAYTILTNNTLPGLATAKMTPPSLAHSWH